MRAAVLALTWRAASRSAPRSSITRTTSLWPICDAIHSGAVPSCGERTQHPRDGGLRPREGSQRPTTRVILTHVSRLALGSARTTWVSASIQILAYKSHCTAGPFTGLQGTRVGSGCVAGIPSRTKFNKPGERPACPYFAQTLPVCFTGGFTQHTLLRGAPSFLQERGRFPLRPV